MSIMTYVIVLLCKGNERIHYVGSTYIRLNIKKNLMFSSISGFDKLPLFRFRYRTGFTYNADVVVGRLCFRCGRVGITDRNQEHRKYNNINIK